MHAGPRFSHYLVEPGLTPGEESASAESKYFAGLITDGPFKYVRHPAYCGFFMWAMGLQLIMVNPVSLVLYARTLFVFFRDRVRVEEKQLIALYKQQYVEYKHATPSGLPFIH